MKPSELLTSKGWRFIGEKKLRDGGTAKFFDHPRHQHDWGMFTTTEAMKHQKDYEKNMGCDCIKPEGCE